MLEKLLARLALMILSRLTEWAAREVNEWLQESRQNKADEVARLKLKNAQSKEKKIRRAKDLLDTATRA